MDTSRSAACKQLGVDKGPAGHLVALEAAAPPPRAAQRVAVCLTGQPRSFSVAYTQWVAGGFLSYLRGFGELDCSA